MSWGEAFASRYEEWSAHMTADVGFYVELARQADGPLVELGIGNGRVAIPVAQATGQPVIGVDTSPAMLEQARSGPCCTCRPGPTAAAPSSASPGPCGRVGGSPGTPWRSTTGLRPAWTASTRTSRSRTPSGTGSVTTGSTSPATTAPGARCGGRRRTSGSGCSRWPVSRWRPCTAASPASRSPMTAGNTSSWLAAEPRPPGPSRSRSGGPGGSAGSRGGSRPARPGCR
jgi:hypothetical protein